MAQLRVNNFDTLIGKRIQLKRKEAKLSAEELSEKIGISQQQLSRYERGENKINLTHLIQISEYLETPLNWFLLDCYPSQTQDDLKARLDYHWDNFDNNQKQAMIRFLDLLITV